MSWSKEYQDEVNDRTRSWAQGEDANVKAIEQNGKLGLYDKLVQTPVNYMKEKWLEWSEPEGQSTHVQRHEALDAALNRAPEVYRINQLNQNLPLNQPPIPTPTPVSGWVGLQNQGLNQYPSKYQGR